MTFVVHFCILLRGGTKVKVKECKYHIGTHNRLFLLLGISATSA